MARIRSIKPEFFTSETIAALSVPARLTFVGLWTHADDYGRALDNSKLLKAAVWPLDDDVGASAVEAHLGEFVRAGLVCRYEVAGKRYLHVPSWPEHQRPKNPAAERIPPCPKQSHGGDDPVDVLPHDDPSPTPALPQDGDRPSLPRARVRSREQGDGAGSREGVNTVVEQARPVSVDRLVFEAWRKATGRTTRTQLDARRRRAIQRALAAYPLDDVLDAVHGWQHDPWTERPRYNDLTVLLRDADHIEKFRDLWRVGPQPLRPGQAGYSAVSYARQRAAEARAREATQP